MHAAGVLPAREDFSNLSEVRLASPPWKLGEEATRVGPIIQPTTPQPERRLPAHAE